MDSPRFSIVIPTRDRPGPLRSCLSSIAALDYEAGFEVVVVDDGGSVRLDEALGSLGRTLDLHVHRQANAGPAAARDAGAKLATGELLAFTDDDLVVGERWLAELDRASREQPNAALGGRTTNGLPGNPYDSASARIVELAYAHHSAGGELRFLPSNNLCVPADGFHELGGFNPAFRVSEDRDFCDRWLAAGRRLALVPRAEARHYKGLKLAGFVRQHYGYGRGAFAYHRGRAARGREGGGIEASFYADILRDAFAALRRGELGRVALLGIWQLANLAGFCREALAPRNRTPLPG